MSNVSGWDVSIGLRDSEHSISEGVTPPVTSSVHAETSSRPVKSRRIRPTLSCSECKRRKIKCDRQVPCKSCVQRKREHKCAMPGIKKDNTEGDSSTPRVSNNNNTSPQSDHSENVDNTRNLNGDTEYAARVLEQLAGRAPKFGQNMSGTPQMSSDTLLHLTRLPSTGTSIAALACHPRPQYLEPFTLAIPHLSPHRPIYHMSKIWSVFPNREVLKSLYRRYWTDTDTTSAIMFRPIFDQEYAEFWRIVEVNPNFEIDPAWVSILLMICAIGYLRSDTIHDSDNGIEQVEGNPNLPFNLYEAALVAMKHADWSRRPQFRSVQAIALFIRYLKDCGHFYTSEWFAWVAAGLRLCQTLGYHNLGSNPETMPREDPALPPGRNGRKRELVKRVWWFFVSQDRSQSVVPRHTSYAAPTEFTTNMPLNLNNEDLSATEIARVGKPEYIQTDSSNDILVIRLLDWQKDLAEHELRRDLSYEKLLDFERRLRDLENRALATLDTFGIVDKTIESKLFAKRCLAKSAVHQRISRLHLPYLFRGYTQKKYELSRDTCILSARTVILSHWQLFKLYTVRWNVTSHILSCALVLFVDIFLALEHQLPMDELNEKEDTIQKACSLLENSYKHINSLLRNSEKMARHLVCQLMREYEQQKEACAALASQRGTRRMEPIWTIFKRVTESMGSNLALNNNGSNSNSGSHTNSQTDNHSFVVDRANAKDVQQTPHVSTNDGVILVEKDNSGAERDIGEDFKSERMVDIEAIGNNDGGHDVNPALGTTLNVANIGTRMQRASIDGNHNEVNILEDTSNENMMYGLTDNQWMESSLVDFINELNGDVNPFGIGLDWGEYNNNSSDF